MTYKNDHDESRHNPTHQGRRSHHEDVGGWLPRCHMPTPTDPPPTGTLTDLAWEDLLPWERVGWQLLRTRRTP